jgi:hypothetical protein
LQNAFNVAVGLAAGEIVRERIAASEEFKTKVRAAIGEAMLQIDKENFTDWVGSALASALKRD